MKSAVHQRDASKCIARAASQIRFADLLFNDAAYNLSRPRSPVTRSSVMKTESGAFNKSSLPLSLSLSLSLSLYLSLLHLKYSRA